MTNKRSIFIFWALFLVPTLIVAGYAFRLLSHEQDRIRQSAKAVLAEKARTASETVHLTLEDVQQNLTLSLFNLEPHLLKNRLLDWERTNPLVRNVFIYSSEKGLVYPYRTMASTKEEQRFANRYDALFSGRTAFDFNKAGKPEQLRETDGIEDSYRSDRYSASEKTAKKSSRRTLVALSRVFENPAADQAMTEAGPDAEVITSERTGWIPWFSENRLFILGWVQKQPDAPVYGIELELMTLLSMLVADFPKLDEDRAALVMMDGSGNFMHQSGRLDVSPDDQPVITLPVSAFLPHWRMAVYMAQEGSAASKGFLYLSVLLLGIFICAIISGGILLTRMTLKNMKDAYQKTSFVSSVSHELKTPLTSIRMYAELLLSGRVKDPEKTGSYLGVIVDESHRLTRLINNVLDFGRLEQGRKTYHYSVFDAKDFLGQIIDAHSIRMENQNLEVIREIPENEVMVSSDKDALEQVVLNLLDNALKYAGDGRYIKFVLEDESEFIQLKICDDGPGIPGKQREKIFDKFHRLDNSLSAKQPGSGLGLSIARQILRDLGGDLVCGPEPGGGSCFTARIRKK